MKCDSEFVCGGVILYVRAWTFDKNFALITELYSSWERNSFAFVNTGRTTTSSTRVGGFFQHSVALNFENFESSVSIFSQESL